MEKHLKKLNEILFQNIHSTVRQLFEEGQVDDVLFDLSFSSKTIQSLKNYNRDVSPILALKQFVCELITKITNIYQRHMEIKQTQILSPVPLDFPILQNHPWLKKLLEILNKDVFESGTLMDHQISGFAGSQFQNVVDCFKQFQTAESFNSLLRNESIKDHPQYDQIAMVFQKSIQKTIEETFAEYANKIPPKQVKHMSKKTVNQSNQQNPILIDSNADFKSPIPNQTETIKNQTQYQIAKNDKINQKLQDQINRLFNSEQNKIDLMQFDFLLNPRNDDFYIDI